MRRSMMCAVLLLALVGAAPALARAPETTTATLTVDSYASWHHPYTRSATTTYVIPKGAAWVATVSGTFSYWGAINFFAPQAPWTVVCGTPLASTEFSGSLGGVGPAGMDAAFIFARPWTSGACAAAHLPARWAPLGADTGAGWVLPKLLGPIPTAPNRTHTYLFALVGGGARASFRLYDENTLDNYGEIRISLRPATAAQCAANYTEFGLASAAACSYTGAIR